jgi:prepilin-type N-terminal cleavage/methylation domain-containing protein
MKRTASPTYTACTESGFTLIELMIVVVIIGILAALAVPRFDAATQASKQQEASLLLKQVHTLQEAHFDRYGSYAATMDELRPFGWAPPSKKYFDTPAVNAGGGPGSTSYIVCMTATDARLENRSINESGTFGTC